MAQIKLSRPKDTKVTICDNNGSILLRFSYQRKTYNLSLGLAVSPQNLKIAEKKCVQITQDIIFNNFSLEKYNLGHDKPQKPTRGRN